MNHILKFLLPVINERVFKKLYIEYPKTLVRYATQKDCKLFAEHRARWPRVDNNRYQKVVPNTGH